MDNIKKAFEKIKERGYSLADMKKTEEKIRQRRRSWRNRFDSFIDTILHDDPNRPVDKIIEIADKLADAREEHLDHKFDDGILEDD